MATSQILSSIDQNIDTLYNKPLSNNPNMTYGNVLSPEQTKLYLIDFGLSRINIINNTKKVVNEVLIVLLRVLFKELFINS